jgi:hypothetical protein
MAKLPVTYNGTSANNLFVSGWKNGKEIKLKVKDIGCCGPISVENPSSGYEIYSSEEELKAAAGEGKLSSGSIYIVLEANNPSLYLYHDGNLLPISSSTRPGETQNSSFVAIDELYTAKDNNKLVENGTYIVTDNGTVSQYLYTNGKLIQIAGDINEITEGSIENENISDVSLIPNGILDFNLEELVNGDYRYKNHTELHTVISDMPNLISGRQMFWGCPLTTFCGNLSSLEDGFGMFGKSCKLDYDSILNITDSLKNVTSLEGEHIITIGYSSELVSDEELASLTAELNDKGWTVKWFKDGSSELKLS